MVFETLVFSPLNHLTRLIARENFIIPKYSFHSGNWTSLWTTRVNKEKVVGYNILVFSVNS